MALQSMTALASITLQEASASVSFSGIPQNYRDLVLITSITAGDVDEQLRFNGDSGPNYNWVRMWGDGSSASSTSSSNTTYIRNTGGNLSVRNNIIIQIMDYSATNKHKATIGRGSNPNTLVMGVAGRWANTAAINSITYSVSSGNFSSGSTFNLYGRIA